MPLVRARFLAGTEPTRAARAHVIELWRQQVLGVRVARAADVVRADDLELGAARPIAAEEFLGDPCVSLFALDAARDEAMFVVLRDPAWARAQPFLYEAQRAGARAVVRVPLGRLLEWTAREDPVVTPVLLFSTARSGSTLLVRALDRVPGVQGISEPDVFTQIAEDPRLAADPRAADLARASASWLFGRAGRSTGATVLKFRTQVLAAASTLRRAWPESPVLFSHRALVPSVESFVQAFAPARQRSVDRWLAPLQRQWLRLRIRRDGHGFAERLWPPPGPPPADDLATLGDAYPAVAYWLAARGWMARLRDDGVDALSIDYDELVRAPAATMVRVLSHCGIDRGHVGDVLGAFEHHAQLGSRVVRMRSSERTLDDREVDRIAAFLARHARRFGVDPTRALDAVPRIPEAAARRWR